MKPRQKFSPDDPRFYDNDKSRTIEKSKYERQHSEKSNSRYSEEEYYKSSRKNAELRQRSASPEEKVSPKDRFKDAKEKFLLMEKERLEDEQRNRIETPISPVINKERPVFVRRHESLACPKIKDRFERFAEERDRFYAERSREKNGKEEKREDGPVPAPRSLIDEVRYRKDVPFDRFRNKDKNSPQRRSMFNLIEEEHRKNSNEIAKELKRRSYMEQGVYEGEFNKERSFAELPESERYFGAEKDYFGVEKDGYFSKSSLEIDRVGEMKYDPKFVKNHKSKNMAGYRHSYVEPKVKGDKIGKKFYSDLLHRANSSVSNTGRVGIASIHPY